MYLLLLIILLYLIELLYFKYAQKFNIIDKPNNRSAHSEITIRGGGIIFCISIALYFYISDYDFPYFFIGLTFVSIISFIDDIYTLSNRYRIPFQILAIGLVLFQVGYFTELYFEFLLLLVIGVGVLNAYNFMDGINGMTGGYSFIAISSLWLLNNYFLKFIENDIFYFVFASLLVFNFFNFRIKAKCFAGDVGSVSMGVIIIFILLKLISASNNYIFILFLAIYGIDTVLTIIFRILNKENIFKAHNTHLFQILIRNGKYSHLKVSFLYMLAQMLINLVIIFVFKMDNNIQILVSIIILLIFASIYLTVRRKFVNKSKE